MTTNIDRPISLFPTAAPTKRTARGFTPADPLRVAAVTLAHQVAATVQDGTVYARVDDALGEAGFDVLTLTHGVDIGGRDTLAVVRIGGKVLEIIRGCYAMSKPRKGVAWGTT